MSKICGKIPEKNISIACDDLEIVMDKNYYFTVFVDEIMRKEKKISLGIGIHNNEGSFIKGKVYGLEWESDLLPRVTVTVHDLCFGRIFSDDEKIVIKDAISRKIAPDCFIKFRRNDFRAPLFPYELIFSYKEKEGSVSFYTKTNITSEIISLEGYGGFFGPFKEKD